MPYVVPASRAASRLSASVLMVDPPWFEHTAPGRYATRPGRLSCTVKVNTSLCESPRTNGLRPRADHKRLTFSDDKHDHGSPLHLCVVFVNPLLSSAF